MFSWCDCCYLLAGCTETEYVDLMRHGWFGPRCLCDIKVPAQRKQYRSASTSTQPSDSPNACSNCDVPRRVSPSRSSFLKPSPCSPHEGINVQVGAVARVEADGAANAMGEFVAVTGMCMVREASGLTELEGEQYCTINPCYKSSTPPEDVAVSYPLLLQPLSLLDATPASLPSLQFCRHPDVIPPRSSTAPNVRGLEEVTESMAQLHTQSPRASWAGPCRSSCSSPGSPANPRRRHDPSAGKWPIYDEVYIPHCPSPDLPVRSSSLLPVGQKPEVPAKPKRLECGSRSHIPRMDGARPVCGSPRLQQRSVSQQAMHMGASSLRCSSHKLHQCSTPSLHCCDSHPPGAVGGMRACINSPSPVREVWIPQIQHQQSASFTGLPPAEEDTHHQHRLSQSCEQLSQQQSRRSRRRVPTPPRVLSPSMENITCQPVADIWHQGGAHTPEGQKSATLNYLIEETLWIQFVIMALLMWFGVILGWMLCPTLTVWASFTNKD